MTLAGSVLIRRRNVACETPSSAAATLVFWGNPKDRSNAEWQDRVAPRRRADSESDGSRGNGIITSSPSQLQKLLRLTFLLYEIENVQMSVWRLRRQLPKHWRIGKELPAWLLRGGPIGDSLVLPHVHRYAPNAKAWWCGGAFHQLGE
jgi:hypothetical protein